VSGAVAELEIEAVPSGHDVTVESARLNIKLPGTLLSEFSFIIFSYYLLFPSHLFESFFSLFSVRSELVLG
jgi:hypothetical protein